MNKEIYIVDKPEQKEKKLNIAAYCRVSSDSDEQRKSLENQQTYYTKLIRENSSWRDAGVYVESETGKSMMKRREFKRLLTKCKKGEVDMIITKSVSRFSRNTMDALQVCRLLKILGVEVMFEQENLQLSNPQTTHALEIYFALAQEESRSKSVDIKMGIRQGFHNGTSGYQNFTCYGYKKGVDGLEIDPMQATVVKLIFNLRANGKSLSAIAEELKLREILSPTGKETWSRETINKLLRNEKVCGHVRLQKTYVDDFLDGKQRRNQGELEQVLIKNNHPYIIEDSLFFLVNKKKMQSNPHSICDMHYNGVN